MTSIGFSAALLRMLPKQLIVNCRWPSLSLLLSALFIVATPVLALDSIEPAGEWQRVNEKDGIVLEQRQVVGSDLKETRGSILIPATIDAIAAVLDDAEACSEWMHDCKIGRSVEVVNLGERVNYSVIDAPLWYDDRDLYVRSKIRFQPESGVLKVELRGDANYSPLEKGRVRVLDLFASWTFEQMGESRVKATYQMYNNPQIGATKQVNKNLAKTVFHTLRNLRKIAQKPKYANATFEPALKAAVSE